MQTMKCFVIMPFDPSFNDVYQMIKKTAESAVPGETVTCRRLDEIKLPGRISDDLIREINQAVFCVSDLSGNNPNVMWETGYAMALKKPIVFISQDVKKLPFDIRDMRTIPYNRLSLNETLEFPLTDTIRETLGEHMVPRQDTPLKPHTRQARTIAVTGSMQTDTDKCRSRVPVLLSPYLGDKVSWYCGSVGTADEAIMEYLVKNDQDITVVGYHSYDISEKVLKLVREHEIPFIDARKEALPKGMDAPSERDLFFLMKADLQILLWSGTSSGTLELIDWYKEKGKDYVVGFI